MGSLLTKGFLRDRFYYNSVTGILTYNKTISRCIAGSIAGFAANNGYIYIKIKGKTYKLHRIIWLYVYGKWPDHQIDHINGDRKDNRLCNLRDVTPSGNAQNRRKSSKNSSSEYLGVSKQKGYNKFKAQIQIGDKRIYLGVYETPEAAYEAYLNAKRELHITCTL